MKILLVIEDISGIISTREVKLTELIILLRSKRFIREMKTLYFEKIKK